VNLLAQAHGTPYQLQLPLFTGQGWTTAFLSIQPEKWSEGEAGNQDKGEAGKGYKILFLLDLEGLGQTKIDAHLAGKSLWVTFYVSQNDSVPLLQNELPGFRLALEAMGYDKVLLVAKPVKLLSPENEKRFAVLARGVPANVSLLDVKA
jgi:hypothetical protein